MKKFLLLLSAAVAGALPMAAQLNGDGFYRVQNFETERYVYITDDKGHVDPNTTSVDVLAIQLWKDFNKACSDPATVLYLKYQGGKDYDIQAQGTGINQIINYNVTIRANNDGTYFAYGTQSGVAKYLGDANSSDSAEGTMSTEATGNRRKWWIKPINGEDGSFFGIKPTISVGGKHYQPMYASFPMSPKSSGVKIYVVSTCGYGMAVLSPVEGVMPGGAGCIIECSSQSPSDNRMNVGGTPASISSNLLSGVYFENYMKTHENLTRYDRNTMRVLGKLSDGSLGFVTANLDYLPANQAYLRVAAGSPSEIRIVSQSEYDKAVSSLPVSVSISPAQASMYVGSQLKLTATVAPDNASDKSITWTTSNPAIATVGADGVVKAIAKGTVEIQAKTINGITSKCTITVKPAYPETITVTPASYKFYVGDTYQLSAALTPDDVQNATVTWSSSDASVVTVDNTGKITAVKVGTATITASTADGKTSQSVITVNPVYPTSITLNSSERYINAKETYQLVATLTPSDVKDTSITWSSADESIATVDANGKVTGVASGNTVITAASPGGAKATCAIRVMAQMPESVSISFDRLVMEVEDSRYLSATVLPAGAVSTVTWSSSDNAVVTVSTIGKVVAVGEGEATVTVTTSNGLTATCSITVLPKGTPATSVTVIPSSVALVIGESKELSVQILPDNVTNRFVTWSSNNAKVASVDSEGRVSAVSAGTSIITAQCGSVRGTCVVTVTEEAPEVLVSAIQLSRYSYEGDEGTQFTLSATVLPENATDKSVIWSSDNEAVATVSGAGVVSLVAPGKANIIATAADASGVSAKCAVTVREVVHEIKVTSIVLNHSAMEAEEGTQFTLSATVLPENATDKRINWSSDNEAVATVSADGVVSVLSYGKANIIATAADGSGVTAKCELTGVSAIFTVESDKNQPVSVYTIEGILLHKAATPDDIRALTPGFYIIGGQKVLVK